MAGTSGLLQYCFLNSTMALIAKGNTDPETDNCEEGSQSSPPHIPVHFLSRENHAASWLAPDLQPRQRKFWKILASNLSE
jgi:hypothetical protein